MSAEAPAAYTSHPADDARVAVIAALGVEMACLRRVRRSPRLSLLQCGPGAARAARAAEAAVRGGADALLSWGTAGGLEPDAAPGAVALPHTVVTGDGRRFDVDVLWREALAAALDGRFPVIDRPLLAAEEVLETPAAKAAAARAHGASSADMESGAVAAVAADSGVAFVAVRAVADGFGDPLPAGIEHWVDGGGRARIAPVAAAALSPTRWRALWRLARRYRAARRTLDGVAAALAPDGFLLERRERLTS